MSVAFEALLVLLVTLASAAFAYLYRQSQFWQRHGVPHVRSLPLLGSNYRMFTGRCSMPEYLLQIYGQFPKCRYFGTMTFHRPTMMLRDPELIKEVTVKSFDHFPDHRSFIDEHMDPIIGRNVFSLRGDRWREMRNTLSPSFTASKMKFLFQLVSKCSEDFVDHLERHKALRENLELRDTFTRYTNDVIATAAFGINVDSMKDRDNEFYRRGQEVNNFSTPWNIMKFILYISFPWVMRNLGVKLFPPKLTNFFRSTIAETMEMRRTRGIVRPDMIHMLMQAQDKGSEAGLSVDDIAAQAFIFFVAGFETSAIFMCLVAYELTINPDVQERLRREVDGYAGKEVTYEDIRKMEYMDMVFSEVLRKYPPTGFIDRLCAKDFRFPPAQEGCSEFVLREGMDVWVPVYAIHHDPQFYPNPQKFDPERFAEGNKEKINPYTYLPFGIGPRMCIGNRFLLMESKIVFAQLLRKFRFARHEKTTDTLIFGKKHLSMLPDGGCWIRLEDRA